MTFSNSNLINGNISQMLEFFLGILLFKVVYENRTYHVPTYAKQSGHRKNGHFSHVIENVSGKRFSVTLLWGGNFEFNLSAVVTIFAFHNWHIHLQMNALAGSNLTYQEFSLDGTMKDNSWRAKDRTLK
jgi:hypothetical protein